MHRSRRSRMRNRIKEVLMTYLRRSFSSWPGMAALLAWIILILAGIFTRYFNLGSGNNESLAISLVTSSFCCFIWLHFRQQMKPRQRRLMPGFLWPHIAVFIVISTLSIGISAAIICHNTGAAPMTSAALALTACGVYGCIMMQNSSPKKVFCAAALFMILEMTLRIGRDMPLLLVGLWFAMTIFTGILLIFQNDDHSANNSPHDFSLISSLFYWAGLLAGRCFRPMRRSSRSAKALANRPILHSTMNGNPGAVWAYFWRWHGADAFNSGLSLILLPLLFLMAMGPPQGFSLVVCIGFGIPFVVVFPALYVAGLWLHRWSYMEMELLRPVSRTQFIRGLLFAISIQVLLVFLSIAGTASFIAGAGAIGSNQHARLIWLLPFCLAALLIQGFGCILCIWIISHRRIGTLLILLVFVLGSDTGFHLFAGGFMVPKADALASLQLAAEIMLLGLIIIPLVYRRWLNLEIG